MSTSTTPKSLKVDDKIWMAIRKLRQFTTNELAQIIGDKHLEYIISYISLLHKTGYLKVISKNKYTRTYQIIRDTGPKTPVVYKSIYDPNNNMIYIKTKENGGDNENINYYI